MSRLILAAIVNLALVARQTPAPRALDVIAVEGSSPVVSVSSALAISLSGFPSTGTSTGPHRFVLAALHVVMTNANDPVGIGASCTCGGVAMNFQGEVSALDPANGAGLFVFALTNPPTGPTTIACTVGLANKTLFLAASVFDGVNQNPDLNYFASGRVGTAGVDAITSPTTAVDQSWVTLAGASTGPVVAVGPGSTAIGASPALLAMGYVGPKTPPGQVIQTITGTGFNVAFSLVLIPYGTVVSPTSKPAVINFMIRGCCRLLAP